MFFLVSFGLPILLLFVMMLCIFVLPVYGVYRAGRALCRLAPPPEPTPSLLKRLEDIPEPFPSPEAFMVAHGDFLLAAWGKKVPTRTLYNALVRTTGTLFAAEQFLPLVPPPPEPHRIARGRYRDEIISGIRTAQDAPQILSLINTTFTSAYTELLRKLPPSCFTTPELLRARSEPQPLFSVKLAEMVRNPGEAVADVIKPFHDPEVTAFKLFEPLRYQLNRNLYEASGQHAPAPEHKLIRPYEYKGTAAEMVKAYLGYTPLQYLFDVEVPLPISAEKRCEHWHVCAGSGHGKTQTLQHILMHDLMDPAAPSLVVIDSQGDLLWKIQHLQIFADHPDRLILIDPQYSPALGMFDMSSERLEGYSPTMRETVELGILELYAYIFAAMSSELTGKQSVVFSFVVRLMLNIPGATLHTLLELMEEPAKSLAESRFAAAAEALDPTARSFFENQFFNKQAFGQTRQQLARRLYAVLSVPAFERCFSAPKNKVDFFKAIETPGTVLLVNTNKALLKTEASALLGRWAIAQVMAAAFERISIPEKDRRPTYLVIDEAADYFSGGDDALESLLSQARKFKLGVLFAHQHMEQLSPALRSSVASNTSIKFAGGVSDRDARMLDADMRSSSAFIGSMQKRMKHTEFAAYVRNETATAVRVKVPFGSMEAAPRMSPDDHRRLIAFNTARYSVEGQPQSQRAQPRASPQKLPEAQEIQPSIEY